MFNIDLGGLKKPATVLIKKISNAIGVIYEPRQIVRAAKAEVEAELIREESKIEITDLQHRAMHRLLGEEEKKQLNMESITKQAIPLLDENSSPEQVDDDWITNFFDKCRIVSNSEMQLLWSKVLAGEANFPGAFSKKTVNLLPDLDKGDAELFTRLCGFAWKLEKVTPLIFDNQADIYNRHGINFESLSHLDSLGLIQTGSFGVREVPKKLHVSYHERDVEITMPKDADNSLEIGKVLLTKAGQELAPVCGSLPIKGFFDFVYDKWAKQSYVPQRETEQGTPADG